MTVQCETCDYYDTDKDDQPCCGCTDGINWEKCERMDKAIAICPGCGNVPRIAYCMGEYFVVGTDGCEICGIWNVMSASEEWEIERWNERVKEEHNESGDV